MNTVITANASGVLMAGIPESDFVLKIGALSTLQKWGSFVIGHATNGKLQLNTMLFQNWPIETEKSFRHFDNSDHTK